MRRSEKSAISADAPSTSAARQGVAISDHQLRELRILVQGAQALARALPANFEDAPGSHVEARRGDEAPQMTDDDVLTFWQRLRRRVGGA